MYLNTKEENTTTKNSFIHYFLNIVNIITDKAIIKRKFLDLSLCNILALNFIITFNRNNIQNFKKMMKFY